VGPDGGGDRASRCTWFLGADAPVEEPGRRSIALRFTLGPTARRITYRFTKDGRAILLTTFRKQRNNERAEIARARKAAAECAKSNP
jgi:hypothetical protein